MFRKENQSGLDLPAWSAWPVGEDADVGVLAVTHHFQQGRDAAAIRGASDCSNPQVTEDLSDQFAVGVMTDERANSRSKKSGRQHCFVPEGIDDSLLARIDRLRSRSAIVKLAADGVHPTSDKASPGQPQSMDQPRMPQFHRVSLVLRLKRVRTSTEKSFSLCPWRSEWTRPAGY
jgi:hypothetical protein